MDKDFENLSDDEKEIVRQVLDGKTNQEISNSVFRSLSTVQNKLTTIYASLNVSGRKELKEKGRKCTKK